ncbi:MAG: ATP synthase F0 subunit B [Pseudobdellovibrio sp.]
MKIATTLLIVLISVIARANGGEHGGAEHDVNYIPFEEIGWQALNLGILLVAIIYFIRKSMVDAFANRQKEYLERSERTKAALKEAETALSEIKGKLSELESSEQKSLATAKQEAAALKENMIKEAQLASEKIKKDAELTLANEVNKAKAEINATILSHAISTATQKIASANASNSGAQEAGFVKQLEQVKA